MNITTEYVQVDCIKCHALFGLPKTTDNHLRQTHDGFWCPTCGYSMAYLGKTAAEKALAEAARLKDELRHTNDILSWTEAERATSERSARAHKGRANRLKRLIAEGKCPCCGETFEDVYQHMVHEHPKFVEDNADQVAEAAK